MTKRKNTLKSTSELTLKQKAFVDIYVSNWGEISKTEAATRAGYTSAKKEGPTEIASRLTDPNKNPHVVRYMEMRYNQELKKHEGDKLKKYKRFDSIKLAPKRYILLSLLFTRFSISFICLRKEI